MRKRDHEIKIRMTQRELEELGRKVARTNLNRETYIREVLAERDIPLRLDADAFALTMELRKIGTQLNIILPSTRRQDLGNLAELHEVNEALWICLMMIQDAYYDLGANKGGSRWGRLRREKQSEV